METSLSRKEADQFFKKRKSVQEILEMRANMLPRVIKVFTLVTTSINSLYNSRYHLSDDELKSSNNDELKQGSTRILFTGLLATLPELRYLWLNMPLEFHTNRQNYLLHVFGFCFNKMKESYEDMKVVIKVSYIQFGTLSVYVPYPVHTHFDVPFFMRSFNLGNSRLSLIIAASHHILEEGNYIYIDKENNIKQRPVHFRHLMEKLPNKAMAAQTAIGVLAFSKLSVADINIIAGAENIANLQKNNAFYNNMKSKYTLYNKQIWEDYVDNFFTIPGLSLQINIIIKILNEKYLNPEYKGNLSRKQIREVIKSIIEVKIADKMTSMVSFPRLIINKSPPSYNSYKVLLFACAVMNESNMLKSTLIKLEMLDIFEYALKGYAEIMNIKMKEVNEFLIEQGQLPLLFNEIDLFFNNIYKPILDESEKLMAPFIDVKMRKELEYLL